MNKAKKIIAIIVIIWGCIFTLGGIGATFDAKEDKVGLILVTVLLGVLPLLGGVYYLFKRKATLDEQNSNTASTASVINDNRAKEFQKNEVTQELKQEVKEDVILQPVYEKQSPVKQNADIKKSTIVKTEGGLYLAMHEGAKQYFQTREDAEDFEKHGGMGERNQKSKEPVLSDEDISPEEETTTIKSFYETCPSCEQKITKGFLGFKSNKIVTLPDGIVKCLKCSTMKERFKSEEFSDQKKEVAQQSKKAAIMLIKGLFITIKGIMVGIFSLLGAMAEANNTSGKNESKSTDKPFFGTIKQEPKMMTKMSSSKSCVTCDFWQGSRNVKSHGYNVKLSRC